VILTHTHTHTRFSGHFLSLSVLAKCPLKIYKDTFGEFWGRIFTGPMLNHQCQSTEGTNSCLKKIDIQKNFSSIV